MENQNIRPGNLTKPFGKSGTLMFRGFITDEEYNKDLVGKQAIRIYDEMRRSDGTVHQALEMVKLPILGLNWNLEAATDDELDQYIARFVEQELKEGNINWNTFLEDGLEMLDCGYSIIEKTYGLTEFEGKTRLGLSELGYRKQKSLYSWETKEGKPGITQQLIGDTISIPMEKLIIFTNKKKGDNYEGISLLRYCYRDWYMKKTLIKVNGINIERLGAGVPVLEFGDNISPEEKERARQIARQFRANEEAFLEKPANSKFEMLDMKSSSTKDGLPTIKYHDMEIAGSVLSSFMKLGSTQTGSRAVGDVQYKPYLLQEEALAQNIQSTIQEQLIKQLCDINFSDLPNGYPKLKHGKFQDDDIAALATAVQNLSTAGFLTSNFETEQHLRRAMHLPELTKEDKKAYEDQQKQNQKLKDSGKDPNLNNQQDPTKKKAAIIADAKRVEKKLLDVVLR